MPTLDIQDLHVSVERKEILKGITLRIAAGETHALMGPNGSGKSTLASVLMGDPRFTVTGGRILLDGEDILALHPEDRAKKGLFLSFQYPVEIPGVTVESFLRLAYNTQRGTALDVVSFHKMLIAAMERSHIDPAFCRRYLNDGFSGGEKKRMEMLQMAILDPAIAILDETDSGLDVDALKVVAEGIAKRQDPAHSTLIITHFSRLLLHVAPTAVHIMMGGLIVKSGGPELAHTVEAGGYAPHGQSIGSSSSVISVGGGARGGGGSDEAATKGTSSRETPEEKHL